MTQWTVGVDLGGTQIRAAAFNSEAEIVTRSDARTPAAEGPAAVIESITKVIRDVMGSSDAEQLAGIGIGAPGPVDPQTGAIWYPPNLPGWGNRSVSAPLQEAFNCPVHVGNDANVAALGEHRFGAGKGYDHVLYVTVSTGIGGGIISHGQMLTGWRGFAAEIGHQTLVPDGPVCGCGQPGHLEALASGTAIARDLQAAIRDGAHSKALELVDSVDEVTAAVGSEAAQAGDALSIEIFRAAGFYLGLGLTNLIHVLEPEVILIGGGVTKAGDVFMDPVRETVKSRVMSEVYQEVRIDAPKLGQDAGLYGAAALAQTS